MKTRTLERRALDWAVAKAIGLRIEKDFRYPNGSVLLGWWVCDRGVWEQLPDYSSNPVHASRLIEAYKISTTIDHSGVWLASCKWNLDDDDQFMCAGKTHIEAAMRHLVFSKLGYDVDIPEELT